MQRTIETVELPNRVKLQYVEQGDPSGVPVVLLHGVTDSWRSFELVLPHLPESIHAFALSQRGHGDADRPASGYRPRDFAEDLAMFMDALDIGQAVIAGHSMGSYAAQRFAIDHPERVLGLVLMGSFTNWLENPVVAEFWEDALSTLEDPVDPGFMREFQESPLMEPAFLETVVNEALKVPARVWREAWRALMEADHSGELGKIEVPTLIVWGEEDELIPRGEQDTLAAAIVGSRLEVYPGVGHGLHWDAPERFAADLVAFTESVAGWRLSLRSLANTKQRRTRVSEENKKARGNPAQTIKSKDDTPIAYRRGGEGPPLVLVHGAAADHGRWNPVLPALEERFTIYAIDRRGRGGSGDGPGYVIEREFEDVAAVIDSIGETVNLLGHSYGALLALEAALLTQNIRKLVLYDPGIEAGEEIYPHEVVERLEALLEAGDRDGVVATTMREVAGLPPETVEHLRTLPVWQTRVAAAHTIPRELRAVKAYRFDPGRFRDLGVPALLLSGGTSPAALRKAAEAVDEALPDSRLVVMPGQGHAAMDTGTDLFTTEVLRFLTGDAQQVPASPQG